MTKFHFQPGRGCGAQWLRIFVNDMKALHA